MTQDRWTAVDRYIDAAGVVAIVAASDCAGAFDECDLSRAIARGHRVPSRLYSRRK